MPKIEKVFAIIDPTTDQQLVLKRAERIAKLRGAKILAHCAIFSGYSCQDKDALKRAEIKRYELWLESLIAPLKENGVDIDYQVEWDPDWRDNLGAAANASGCDMVIKASKKRSLPGRLRKTSDWQLLRTSNVPVFLMKREESMETGRLLAAIKTNSKDEKYTKMNQEILEYCREIIKPYDDGEVHAISAYKDWDDFVNPADLAKKVGIDRTMAHCVSGSPEEAIQVAANEIEAEMVVVGAVPRSGVAGKIFGNTVERVLDRIDCDVMTLVNNK